MKTRVWATKVAFVIPKEAQREVSEDYPGQIGVPSGVVGSLLDLFDACEFICEGVCNPDLLVVEFGLPVTPRCIKAAQRKIDSFLTTL